MPKTVDMENSSCLTSFFYILSIAAPNIFKLLKETKDPHKLKVKKKKKKETLDLGLGGQRKPLLKM